MPIITDWHFYAVAVPAVLLLGVSKSGFGSGFGSLAVPLMALVVPVPQAAAIVMPLLLAVDLLGVRALRRDLDINLFKLLLPAGLIGIVIGALMFRVLDAKPVAGVVGVFALLVVAQRLLFAPRSDAQAPPRWAGALLGVASGFSSFVAHAGGPPIAAYMIPLRLKPMVYAATLSYFFFVVNLAKWVPYGLLGLLNWRNMATGLVLAPLAPVGVGLGVWMARRISQTMFYQLVNLGLLLTGLKLVWDGYF